MRRPVEMGRGQMPSARHAPFSGPSQNCSRPSFGRRVRSVRMPARPYASAMVRPTTTPTHTANTPSATLLSGSISPCVYLSLENA